MKQHTEEELAKLAKRKMDLGKLKDKHIVLHPQISTWRDKEKPDLQMLRSLNTRGQIQAIVLRDLGKKGIQLLAGARRYAHMKLLGWTWDEIDKDIREKVSDRDALILAIEENLHRKNLTVWEEARAINSLLRNKMSIKNVAKLMNRTSSWVSSRKSLFELSADVRKLFEKKDLEFGYSVPLRKLKHLPEAQLALIEKIVEAKESSYGGIRTVENAEEFVMKILKQIKDTEELVLKYGPCPVCESKHIRRGYREGQLVCQSDGCGHEWHGETKEAWAYYELKQDAEKMGITIVEEAPGMMKVTPKEAAEMIIQEERRQREAAKAEEDKLPEKFRCKVRLLALLEPMIAGDNIQKMEIRGEKIEIQLIEGKELYFDGLRKDYVAGEKARIETAGWGRSDSIQRNHDYINGITALDPYGDIQPKE